MELLHATKKEQSAKLSSQKYVDVSEIRNDVIVLKNGSLRSVLLSTSINFDLKSPDEQEAIIAGYQSFLNSLDFPIQIVVQSRKIDISGYLSSLEKKERTTTNDLMKMQISEYINFVRNLTNIAQIMTRYFYVVVPFYPTESTQKKGLFERVSALVNPQQAIAENLELFETYKNQLWQRVEQVRSGLNRLGVQSTPLNTEELIELLYSSYNPSLEGKSLLKNVNIEDIELH